MNKENLKMTAKIFGRPTSVEGEDNDSFDFTSMRIKSSCNENTWPTYRHIPVVKQQFIPTTDIVREYESKRWYDYLKDAFIIFIWIYFIGIMAFFITIWSVSADGSKSFLVDHFSIAMLCVFLISVAFSLLLTISMIWCRQRCGSFVLASDQEAERVVITRHSSQSDITDAFDTENPLRNINSTLSRATGTSLYKFDSSSSLNGTICNIYNVPHGYSKITRMESLGTPAPHESPGSFKRLDPAGCCSAEPQRNI